ncbi:hypothetical protein AWB69_08965 [Caballeronia udeis]|uniref:Uncharacterized protein n=1 Tax=Caballeronia udeis TaxID=1232866 RepID=A0A158JYC1_9BURK|nr:hypothetical protein [Caballeronia udeis]SAL73250.1 hypothetical protein AWB69_08965 [Caballeronia udeis]
MPLASKPAETTQAYLERWIEARMQEGPHVGFKRELLAAFAAGNDMACQIDR